MVYQGFTSTCMCSDTFGIPLLTLFPPVSCFKWSWYCQDMALLKSSCHGKWFSPLLMAVYISSGIENLLTWSSCRTLETIRCVWKGLLNEENFTKLSLKALSVFRLSTMIESSSLQIILVSAKVKGHSVGFWHVVKSLHVSSFLHFSQPCPSIFLVGIPSQQCSVHAVRRTLLPVWRKAWACVWTTCPRSRCSTADRSAATATWRRGKSVTAGSRR